MFVPAHNERLLNSASRSDADVLILDIEDSVQPVSNKIIARNNIVKYIGDHIFLNRPIYPRINDRESGELLKDIYALTIPGVSGFMYPKSIKGEDIYFIGDGAGKAGNIVTAAATGVIAAHDILKSIKK